MVPNNSHTLALFFKRIQQNKDEFSDTLLDGHETELAKLAGEKVTITGTISGSTIAVQSVSASK